MEKNIDIKNKNVEIPHNIKNFNKYSSANKSNIRNKTGFFQLQFSLTTKWDNLLIFIALLGTIAMGISYPIFSILIGRSANVFSMRSNSTEKQSNEFMKDVENLCIMYVYAALFVWFGSFLMIWLWGYNGRVISNRIREKYFELLMKQEQGWYDNQKVEEIATKFQLQMDAVDQGMGTKIGLIIMAVVKTISSLIVGFYVSSKLSFIVIAFYPFMLATGYLINKGLSEFILSKAKSYEQAGAMAEEILGNIKTVSSFSNFDHEIGKFSEKIDKSYRDGLSQALKSSIPHGFFFFFTFASYTAAVWYGSYLISSKEMNVSSGKEFQIGDVLTVLLSILFGGFAFAQAAPYVKSVNQAVTLSSDFFDLVKRTTGITKNNEGVKPHMSTIKGHICFENVRFSYPINNEIDTHVGPEIIKGINLNFEVGKITAIVGSSGCGKTTTVNLIARLYEISQGKIFLDNYDISDLDLFYYRSMNAYVPQEPVLFNLSIRENITFGRFNISDEQIWFACKLAKADDFIRLKQEGLDYVVGVKGSKLSGGQKQRVAIARALVGQPKIIILDEATSALDNKTEKEVQLILNEVCKGITTIIITHRLSTVINSDKIYVINDGEIAEEGTHNSLLQLNGIYTHLFNSHLNSKQYNYEVAELNLRECDNEKNLNNKLVQLDSSPFLKSSIRTNHTGLDITATKLLSENRLVDRKLTLDVDLRSKSQRRTSLQAFEKEIFDEKIKNLELEKKANTNIIKIIPILKDKYRIIICAAIFSSMMGGCYCVYGILEADLISCLSYTDLSLIKYEGFKLSMYFLILGIFTALISFLQK